MVIISRICCNNIQVFGVRPKKTVANQHHAFSVGRDGWAIIFFAGRKAEDATKNHSGGAK